MHMNDFHDIIELRMVNQMMIEHLFRVSNRFVEVFNKNVYENVVLDLMNKSKKVFPNQYTKIEQQSHGECDFVDALSGKKYDAKLPFLPNQIKMLTDGKEHKPEIEKWIRELHEEASDFNPIRIRDDPTYDIRNTELYRIMKQQLEKDKGDENIVYFIPFPIVLAINGASFLQFASDYLHAIYDCLAKEVGIGDRNIYAIWLSSEKNCYVLRRLNSHCPEFIQYDGLSSYFSCELV